MAVIKSGATSDQWTIDGTSKAGRVTLYNTAGSVISTLATYLSTSRTSPLYYSYSLVDQAGQAAAYDFIALSNPAASGKRFAIVEVNVVIYSVAASATKNSLRLTHCTAEASAGSDDSANIHRILSTQTAASGVLRITDPTVTAGKEIANFGSGGVVTAAGIYSSPQVNYKPITEAEQSIILPGEGLSIRQTIAGDTDQTYDIRLVWVEYTP